MNAWLLSLGFVKEEDYVNKELGITVKVVGDQVEVDGVLLSMQDLEDAIINGEYGEY